jgi:hypothetical protein
MWLKTSRRLRRWNGDRDARVKKEGFANYDEFVDKEESLAKSVRHSMSHRLGANRQFANR